MQIPGGGRNWENKDNWKPRSGLQISPAQLLQPQRVRYSYCVKAPSLPEETQRRVPSSSERKGQILLLFLLLLGVDRCCSVIFLRLLHSGRGCRPQRLRWTSPWKAPTIRAAVPGPGPLALARPLMP